MSTESDQTEEQAIDFAQRLENMLTEVLGQPSDGQYTADPQGARKKRSASYLIKTRDPQGISLTVGGSTILRLSYRYQCSCRDSNSYLQVDESAITEPKATPHPSSTTISCATPIAPFPRPTSTFTPATTAPRKRCSHAAAKARARTDEKRSLKKEPSPHSPPSTSR